MTIGSILASPSTIAMHDRVLLLMHVLDRPKSYIKSHSEYTLTIPERIRYVWYARKRNKHIPLAYITGTKAFYGLEFEVNKHTLVPRPDTELMVELACKQVTKCKEQKTKMLLIDIGTGSGCIPISILSSCDPQSPISNLQALATDISKKVLHTAKKNANKHNVDITFLQGNLLAPFLKQLNNVTIEQLSNVVITANLPYLREDQFESESSIWKEPKSALVADENGLALYRELLEQMQALVTTGASVTAYFEIDPDQEDTITPLVHEYYLAASVILHTDLAGHTRIAEISI